MDEVDESFSGAAAVGLTDLDAQQARDMLAHAGASPRCQTRVNALVAWGVLATSAATKDSKRKAVDGLMDTALNPIESSADQHEILRVAVLEIRRLGDEELRAYAFRSARDRAQRGSREDANAARLALLLAQCASKWQRVKAFPALWWLRFVTMLRTTIECGPVVAGITTAICIVSFGSLIGLGHANSIEFWEVTTGRFIEMGAMSVVAALLAAGTAIPSRLLVDRVSKVIEVVAFTIFVGSVLFSLKLLFLNWAPIVDFVSFDFVDRPSANYLTAANGLDLMALMLGLFVARAVAIHLSILRGKTHIIRAAIVAGGWASAVILLTYLILVHFGWLSVEQPGIGGWLLWVAVVVGSVTGMAWADAADGLLVDANKPDTTEAASRSIFWFLRMLGPATFFILLAVAWIPLHAELADAKKKWKEIAKEPGITPPCGTVEMVSALLFESIPRVIIPCKQPVEITILGPTFSKSPTNANVASLRSDFMTQATVTNQSGRVVDSDAGFPIRLRVPSRSTADKYYVCIFRRHSRCQADPRFRVDASSAMLAYLAGKDKALSWTLNPQTFDAKVRGEVRFRPPIQLPRTPAPEARAK